MKKFVACSLAFGLMFFCGCASYLNKALAGPPFTISKADPNPNVNISSNDRKKTMLLDIDPAITSKSELPMLYTYSNGKVQVFVEDWRESLKSGFTSGFKDFFKIETSKSSSDLVFTLSKAEFEILPKAVAAAGYTVTAAGQITYKATLAKKTGEIIKRSAGVAESKKFKTFSGMNDTWDPKVTASAIESMYEQIAKDFFQ